jgi:hypothetical protein
MAARTPLPSASIRRRERKTELSHEARVVASEAGRRGYLSDARCFFDTKDDRLRLNLTGGR